MKIPISIILSLQKLTQSWEAHELEGRDVYDELYPRSGLHLSPSERRSHEARFVKSRISGDSSVPLDVLFRLTSPALRSSVVDIVNRDSSALWTASTEVARFKDQPLSFALRQCGSILRSVNKAALPMVSHDDDADIPKFFDSRNDFGPECSSLIGTAQDQSNCGSCWAFSTTTALEDRVCLASKGKEKVRLAPLDTLSCCNTDSGCSSFGCNGGDPASAFSWFVHEGVVTGADYGDETTCKPYAFPKCAHHVETPDYEPCSSGDEFETPKCLHKCTNPKYTMNYLKDKHKSVNAYQVSPDEKSIKLDIMKYGPVSAAFEVYEDFLAYTGGIYHHVTGQAVGGHAVKLIGWGEENGVKYWLLLNSWNPSWGENGAFRMRINECGILDEITAGRVKEEETEDEIAEIEIA
jgi:cathepsin B